VYFVLVVKPVVEAAVCRVIGRPDDAGDDDEDTEDLDAGADETDRVAYGRFEGFDVGRMWAPRDSTRRPR
jgi:hypothetical protein